MNEWTASQADSRPAAGLSARADRPGLLEAGELPVRALAGRRAHVHSVELDPRVRVLVGGRLLQADDELGRVPLLPEQAVEDERVDETAWPPGAEPEAPVDGARQPGGGEGLVPRAGPPEPGDVPRELLAPEADENPWVERPDPQGEPDLRQERQLRFRVHSDQ
jgi:hypothetical protein